MSADQTMPMGTVPGETPILLEPLEAAFAEMAQMRAELAAKDAAIAEARLIARWAVEQMGDTLGKQVGVGVVARWDAEDAT